SKAERTGIADDRDVDAGRGGERPVASPERDDVVDQLAGRGRRGILDPAVAEHHRTGGMMVDDDRWYVRERLIQRGHAVGLAGVEDDREIGLAERLPGAE